MEIQLLGSGSSEGFPRFDDGRDLARRTRSGDPNVPPRLGCCLAVSADGERYSIVEAPLHLPRTLALSPRFQPAPGSHAAPIDSVVVTSADLEASGGLFGFASSLSVRIVSPSKLRDGVLASDASFRSLEPAWSGMPFDRPFPLDRDELLEARFFPLAGPSPHHLREVASKSGRARCGLRILDRATGLRVVWAPRITHFDSACLAELRSADLRFIDGTCYAEPEARALRPGSKTLASLGHTAIGGSAGSLSWLAGMQGESVYVHLAGTNPACDLKSIESDLIRAAGVSIGSDGQGWTL